MMDQNQMHNKMDAPSVKKTRIQLIIHYVLIVQLEHIQKEQEQYHVSHVHAVKSIIQQQVNVSSVLLDTSQFLVPV